MGPFAEKINKTLKEIVLTLVKMGHHIIIDDVAFGSPDVQAWKEVLNGYKVLWIGMKTSLKELERRESERGNRISGSARAQYFKVHNGVTYDLEVDTSKEPLENTVRVIKEKVFPKTSTPLRNNRPFSLH